MTIDTARYACQSDPDLNTQFRRHWETDTVGSLASQMDRAADHLLHMGYHRQAERLAEKALAVREAAR